MKYTKKVWLALILVLLMLVGLSACGKGDANQSDNSNMTTNNSTAEGKDEVIETYKGTIGDSKLVGGWTCVSLDNKGDYGFGITYSYDADLYIMFNGQCYGSLLESVYGLEDGGDWIKPVCSIDAQNGEFAFKDVSYNGEPILDIKAEYIFEDIEKSSVTEREDINIFYKTEKDDQLTIHFTGTFKVGPTDIKNIDITLVYEKEGTASVDNEGILWAAMVGEWKDNYGNKWTFMPRTEAKDLGFVMETDGKQYKGQTEEYVAISVDAYEVDDKIVYKMDLSYKDESINDIHDARIISYDGTELTLEQSDGQSLVFKR